MDLRIRGGSDSKDFIHNAGDQVRTLGWEDPLEKGTVTHSSTLAWRIPWMEEQDSPWNRRESDTTATNFHFPVHAHNTGS